MDTRRLNAEEHLELLKALQRHCEMRRFFLFRNEDVDPDQVSGIGIIAEGVVFEDGRVAMRWKTRYQSTAIYDNVDDLLAIHGHSGKTVLKFIDPGPSQ